VDEYGHTNRGGYYRRKVVAGNCGCWRFAAVFSNLSGLFIACSGALGHDVYTHFINKTSTEKQRVVAVRFPWSSSASFTDTGLIG